MATDLDHHAHPSHRHDCRPPPVILAPLAATARIALLIAAFAGLPFAFAAYLSAWLGGGGR
jgi:hypothetical protein